MDSRWSSGNFSSAADAVSTFVVDAGVIGVDGSVLQRMFPVSASATTPVNFPRSGLATAGPIAAAIPDALGIGASVGTGTT